MMFWYGQGMGAWGYALMTVGTVLFWALVIFGIVALVRYLGRASRQPTLLTDRPTPERLLAEGFARGEIDEDEYQRRPDTLRAHHSEPSGL